MKILRIPEHRFMDLTEFRYESRYVDIRDADGTPLRVHYVDEGPRHGPVVLMLHGEPTWSFLYRKVIDVVARAGMRAIAPDLVGFGRSDNFVKRAEYTYARHVSWVDAFVTALALWDITLVCQDWGGLIGLRMVAEHPERFARVLASNTSLPTGDRPMPPAFTEWQRASQEDEHFAAGEIVARYATRPVSAAVRHAYNAPFPDETSKVAARAFPLLVPTTPNDPASEANRRAWEHLSQFKKPFLTVFGDRDPFTFGAERVLQKKIPGAKDQAHRVLSGVGHFIQEDAGDELGRITVGFVRGE